MALFGKREKAYEVWGDKPRWKEARQRLKDAGIKVMETGFYETEAPACGCGAKLDHRDFGPNGKIDRHTYYLSVRPEDVELVAPENGTIQGVVTHLIFKGVHYEMEVTANGFEWLVHSTGMFPVGTAVGIRVDPINIQIMHKPESEDEEAVAVDE